MTKIYPWLPSVGAAALLLAAYAVPHASSQTPAATPVRAEAGFLDQSRGLLSLAPILDQATNAVVNISVSAQVPGQQNPLLQDPFFRRFFGGQEGQQPAQPREIQAAGSGVIIDAGNGYVVTNNHVVEKATNVEVTFDDGKTYTFELKPNLKFASGNALTDG